MTSELISSTIGSAMSCPISSLHLRILFTEWCRSLESINLECPKANRKDREYLFSVTEGIFRLLLVQSWITCSSLHSMRLRNRVMSQR